MKNLLFLLISPFLLVNDHGKLSSLVKSISNSDGFNGSSFSIQVKNLNNGSVLYSHNASTTLAPASTQKLISTALALDKLGGNYQFESHIAIDDLKERKNYPGNLYIIPNGNPCLGSEFFNENINSIALNVKHFCKEQNISKIKGKVIVVDPLYKKETLPRTWIYEDIGNYFGANPTGTILNENILKIYFNTKGDGEKSEIIKTEPNLPWLKIENKTISKGNRDNAYAFSIPNANQIVIEGTVPSNKNNFSIKASLPNPQLSLAYLLNNKLVEMGLIEELNYEVKSVQPAFTKTIGSIKSPQLKDIVKRTNMKSVNILAEALFNKVKSDFEQDFNAFTGKLDGIILKDGSGLSRFNAVSANHLIEVLSFMQHHKEAKNFEASLPVAGESGSISSMFKNHFAQGNLVAKSGYMQGVRSYAGYVKSQSGNYLAFAIILNNYTASASTARKELEKIMKKIAEL